METKVVGDANRSEVARLLVRMEEEYQAAMLGLSGLAQGTPRHSFISTKMENLGELGRQVSELGEDGLAFVIEYVEKLADVK